MKYLIIYPLAKLFNRVSSVYWWVVYARYRYDYALDSKFKFNGKFIQFYGEGVIRTGPESYIGELSTLQTAKGYFIAIGKCCRISHNVRIYTQSSIADFDFSMGEVPSKFGSVTLGDYCWIGANVLINPGVSIGENSVVGANSVVTRDVPPFEIWGGVPAKFIRRKKIS